MPYIYLITFFLTGAGLVVFSVLLSRLIAPRSSNAVKGTPYECGEQPIGSAWVQFNVGFYLVALVFLVFEVETVLLYPCAVMLREVGWIGLLEIVVFVGILLLGLAYAWRKGVLEWMD